MGQAVDGAEKWASDTMDNASKIIASIQDLIEKMRKAGDPPADVKNYCKCNANFEGDGPICQTDCKYQLLPPDRKGVKQCTCNFQPCEGSPCDQVIDYLSKIWNSYKDLKQKYIEVLKVMATEPRSDIIKQLAYSRKTISGCSYQASNSISASTLLSCTVAEDYNLPPINTNQTNYKNQKFPKYCYGVKLGKYASPAESLTDNWFCCQQ